ncbi:Spore coat protein SA [Polystyrenella longa]|uniref:Spore coat protein SA n=1 Tax=Polystyrenella longa TaxID=2528007 RepID=A0A518CSJ5_9PLAN|nr:glycosyltransferase family 4 protein [Polystyrenella longa]QDU82154.1 Spore coat protein SA [Polystyrenella longa]
MSAPSRSRILLCFEYATLNGGEHSLLAVLKQLVAGEFDFIAAAPPHGLLHESLQKLKIPTVPLELCDDEGRKRDQESINQTLKSIIQDSEPALVHGNSLSMGRMLGRIAGETEQPMTAHLRDIVKLSGKAIDDLNQLDRLIAVSQATSDFHQKRGLSEDLMTVLHNGVDCEQFRPRVPSGKLKEELGLPAESFLIGNIGQICLRKGQDIVAEAVCRLIESFPELHLLFVGERHSQKAESREYEQQLHSCFEEAGLSNHVHFLGYRSDIAFILNEIDLLVHTAQQEPLGRVLLEGAAVGCPIVATTAGGTAEILEHQVSGILLPPGDADLLEHVLRDLVPDVRRQSQLGKAARERMLVLFPVEKSAAGLRAIWRQLLYKQS